MSRNIIKWERKIYSDGIIKYHLKKEYSERVYGIVYMNKGRWFFRFGARIFPKGSYRSTNGYLNINTAKRKCIENIKSTFGFLQPIIK